MKTFVHFFIDDAVTGQVEGRAGFVDYIKMYDGALTPSEVAILAGDTGDTDCDGVANHDDFCRNTALPESVPEVILKPEHWALTDGNVEFDTTTMGKGKGPGRHYTTADTAGCSCEQIIEEQGLGDGNRAIHWSGFKFSILRHPRTFSVKSVDHPFASQSVIVTDWLLLPFSGTRIGRGRRTGAETQSSYTGVKQYSLSV